MPIFPPAPAPGSPISAAWMQRLVDACRRCMPLQGQGTLVSYTPTGAIITSTATAAAAAATPLKPFDVRWHKPGEAAGQWEIYMPDGCIAVGANCAFLNPAASDTTGHSGDAAGWRKIPFAAQPADGDVFDVIVHAKQRALASDDIPANGDPQAVPMALAWMHKRASLVDQPYNERVAYAGDSQSFLAASIRYATPSGGSSPVPSISQAAGAGAVRYAGEPDREFDLWWAFELDGASLDVAQMGLLRRTLSTGTEVATVEDPVDVTAATEGIFLRVWLNNGSVELTVATDLSNTAAGADFFIVQLYAVDEYHVASDFRSALWRLPMYLGGASS